MLVLTMLAAVAAEPDIVAHWTTYADNRLCTLVRAFPAAGDGAVLSIMPWPIGARTEITILTDGGGPDAARGNGRLVSDAAGQAKGRLNASAMMLTAPHFGRGTLTIGAAGPAEGGVASGIAPATSPDDIDLRLTTIDLQQAMPGWDDGDVLTIGSDVVVTPAVTLDGADEAVDRLATCQAAQLAGWGMDPGEQARIATPATPESSGVTAWFSSDDYPRQALRAGEEGVVIFRWQIGVDGRTSDCVAVQSSGSAALDEGACKVILRHRFSTPALDAAGQPMVSHGLRRLAWRLPG